MSQQKKREGKFSGSISGILLRFFLSFAILAQSTSSLAQSMENNNETEQSVQSSEIPIAYQAEGSRDVVTDDGIHHEISAEVTVLQPDDEQGVTDLETQVKEKWAEADKNHIPVTLTMEDEKGQIVETTSRATFLKTLQRMQEKTRNSLREMNMAAAKDFKDMFWTTLFMVGARGGVNYWGGWQMGISDHFSRSQSIIAGAASFILSSALLIYGSYYAKWLQINQTYTKLLAKGFVVQFAYLAIVIAASRGETHIGDSFLDFLTAAGAASVTIGVTSLMGTAVQTPFTVTAATLADEFTKKHEGNSSKAALAVGLRNLASVAMSFYVALLTELKMSSNPHAGNLAWAVGGPATLYVAYKQNWKQSSIHGYRWVKEKLSNASNAFSILAFKKFDELVGNLWQQDHNQVLQEIVRASAEQATELRATSCVVMAELAGPQ